MWFLIHDHRKSDTKKLYVKGCVNPDSIEIAVRLVRLNVAPLRRYVDAWRAYEPNFGMH